MNNFDFNYILNSGNENDLLSLYKLEFLNRFSIFYCCFHIIFHWNGWVFSSLVSLSIILLNFHIKRTILQIKERENSESSKLIKDFTGTHNSSSKIFFVTVLILTLMDFIYCGIFIISYLLKIFIDKADKLKEFNVKYDLFNIYIVLIRLLIIYFIKNLFYKTIK